MSPFILEQTLAALLLILPLPSILFTRGLNREPSLLTFQSSMLLFPLVSGAVFLYLPDSDMKRIILTCAQALMMTGLALSRFSRIQEKAFPIEKLMYILPLLPLIFLTSRAFYPYHNWLLYFFIFVGLLAALASLVTPVLRKNGKKQFTWATLFLFGAQLSLLPQFAWPNLTSVLLHGGAYILLFLHFYHESVDHLHSKSIEIDAKTLEWERSIRREVNKRVYEIEKYNSRLIDMAKVDPMTQVYNKVNITNIITALSEDRHNRPFTILLFDIDNFKQINDTRGHLTGDMIIKQVASTACSSVRGIDSVGRYGGDEFIIVLPSTNSTDAYLIADRLRTKIAENENLACTISIGIATFPEDGASARELIQAADEGLYLSKQRGRNSVSHRLSTT